MRTAKLHSCAFYVPERIIPNSYFDKLLGEDVDTWLKQNVEIYNRRWCRENESTADLAEKAAQLCLENSGVRADQLDLIIVATDTPEYISPSTASVVQHRIGAKKAGTFDLNSACAGFVTGLQTGSYYLKGNKNYSYVLVIGAYAMSKYLNRMDKKTVTLFADGAGAILLEGTCTNEVSIGFRGGILKTLGEYHDWMGIFSGGTKQPISAKSLNNNAHLLCFAKKFPKELNPETWVSMIQELCAMESIEPNDIDEYFITQINVNAIRETLDMLGIERSKASTIMHEYGYTGSACIPMAFADRMKQGIIPGGKRFIFLGSGGGLSFSGALFHS
jgi:3-oxoacyl-[acyl-carrier-protein] synthase-3